MTNILTIEGASLGASSSRTRSARTGRSTRSLASLAPSQSQQRSRPSTAGSSRGLPGGKSDHTQFVKQFDPRSRPSTAASRRSGSSLPACSLARPGSARRPAAGRPESAQSTGSVRPEFVFTRPAMKSIAEWMATEAEDNERTAFKRVHSLLAIDSAPGGRATEPIEVTNNNAAAGVVDDVALEELNKGLEEITTQCWRDNLRSSYADQFSHSAVAVNTNNDPARTKEKVCQLLGSVVNKGAIDYVSERIADLPHSDAGLVWDTLQKLAANEDFLVERKQSTASAAHSWNPFYKKEPRRTDYPNLSMALPLEHTFYPPGMQPPPRVTGLDKGAARMAARANDPKYIAQLTHNTLTAASATAMHQNDVPPDTPSSEAREQYYGNNKVSAGVDGGPHTTYTCFARNPYWEDGRPDPVAAPRKFMLDSEHAVKEQPKAVVQAPKRVISDAALEQNAKAELLGSSVPMDLGLPMPRSSYQNSYLNPAMQFNPNVGGGNSMNAHQMPTQCVTGMSAAGVVKSGKPSASHLEFLRRLSKSKNSGSRPQSAVSRPNGSTGGSRPPSASASRMSHRSVSECF